MLHLVRPIHGLLCELAYESLAAFQLGLHLLHVALLLISVGAFSGLCGMSHPFDLSQLYRRRNSNRKPLLRLYARSGSAIEGRGARVWNAFSAGEDFFDDFPSPPALIDAMGDTFHARFGFDKVRLIGMVIRCAVNDGSEEQ